MSNIIEFPKKTRDLEFGEHYPLTFEQLAFFPLEVSWSVSLVTMQRGNAFSFIQMLDITDHRESLVKHYIYTFDTESKKFHAEAWFDFELQESAMSLREEGRQECILGLKEAYKKYGDWSERAIFTNDY